MWIVREYLSDLVFYICIFTAHRVYFTHFELSHSSRQKQKIFKGNLFDHPQADRCFVTVVHRVGICENTAMRDLVEQILRYLSII